MIMDVIYQILVDNNNDDTEQNKFRQKCPPSGIWTHILLIISLMLCQLS